MKNQSKFGSTREFFSSLAALFGGLLIYSSALDYSGPENNFLADNWETPIVALLVLTFGLGWWIEYRIERLVVIRGRKIATRVLFALILAYVLILTGSFVLTQNGFLQDAIGAGELICLSGFFLRQSVAQNNY
jgi:energy-coupling factor transporter transmembrane protein EcfT